MDYSDIHDIQPAQPAAVATSTTFDGSSKQEIFMAIRKFDPLVAYTVANQRANGYYDLAQGLRNLPATPYELVGARHRYKTNLKYNISSLLAAISS